MSIFNSRGKLLLTAEYLVLDGAKALALPTTFSQSLTMEKTNDHYVEWESFDENKNLWFKAIFVISNGLITLKESSDLNVGERLESILKSALHLNPEWLVESGYYFKTQLDFNRQWGLGTSSTLINNIAQSARLNPYKLLNLAFGGSGYDIACANASGPITYQLENSIPYIESIDFNPSFKASIYFVYLNKKQNSREGIAIYKNQRPIDHIIIDEISSITEEFIKAKNLNQFESLIAEHESIISNIIGQEPIQKSFANFDGTLKSLGAWGGDFILATSKTDPTGFFKSKGLNTVIPYSEMVL